MCLHLLSGRQTTKSCLFNDIEGVSNYLMAAWYLHHARVDRYANLDVAGIAASSGSACTSAIVDPSHVLVALGLDDAWNRGHLRLTLGHSTTEQDVDNVIAQLPGMIASLRNLSSRPTPVG